MLVFVVQSQNQSAHNKHIVKSKLLPLVNAKTVVQLQLSLVVFVEVQGSNTVQIKLYVKTLLRLLVTVCQCRLAKITLLAFVPVEL